MDIVFLGTTGVHHTLIAANLYLNNIPDGKYFDIANYADPTMEKKGVPILIGEDDQGNRIYSVGGGKDLVMARKSIEDLVVLLGFSSRDLLVEPISVRGDKVLPILCRIPLALGGRLWSRLGSIILIKGQLNQIRQTVEGLHRIRA
jgi:hypothetical protein